MEATNFFFRDRGMIFGRSMRSVLRSRDTLIILAILMMPIAILLLLVVVVGGLIQTLEKKFSCNYRS